MSAVTRVMELSVVWKTLKDGGAMVGRGGYVGFATMGVEIAGVGAGADLQPAAKSGARRTKATA